VLAASFSAAIESGRQEAFVHRTCIELASDDDLLDEFCRPHHADLSIIPIGGVKTPGLDAESPVAEPAIAEQLRQ
jgi:hypothetical protein